MSLAFKEGDYFFIKTKDSGEDSYEIFRCLKIDAEHEIVHTTLYVSMPVEPVELDIDDFEIAIAHAPIDINGFEKPVVFGNRAVTEDDLDGYYTYLKDADFIAYLQETGQNAEELAAQADELYGEGCDFYDEEDFAKAADKFCEAIEIFPPFYEAADNAGMCFIELGHYEDAIECFEHSIHVNDHTFLTDSCIGECHAALGNKEEARKHFLAAKEHEGLTPEDQAYLLESILNLGK